MKKLLLLAALCFCGIGSALAAAGTLLVLNKSDNTVSLLDPASKQAVATIPTGVGPREVAVSPNGRTAVEPQTGSARLSNQIGSGPVPVGILIVPTLNRAYVANTNADIVSVIDLSSWRIVDRLTAGKEPDGLGYSPLVAR